MNQFEKKVITTWGDAGKAWLESLPQKIKKLSEEWELYKLKPHTHLSYNCVASGYSGAYTDKVILKIGFDSKALAQEAAALEWYDGNGCARLLEHDFQRGALLIEDVIPGTMLKTLFPHEDEAVILRITQVMKQLHARPLQQHEQFPTLEDWLKPLRESSKNQDLENHRLQALELSNYLLVTYDKTVLLHGDLHHENVLSSQRHGWLAIDPKGVIGEPLYEVGACIRNPIEQLVKEKNLPAILEHRIEIFAEKLNGNKQRIHDWSYVQTILAACWCSHDKKSQARWIKIAEALAALPCK